MQILLPKIEPTQPLPRYVFFLLGPIKGGGAWQVTACDELQKQMGETEFAVVVPCRWPSHHELSRHFLPGEVKYERQVQWERKYLECVAFNSSGCIIGWLPTEDPINPRSDGQPYARDTYGELGEWRGRLMYDFDLRFVLGAHPDFPGLDVIRANFNYALHGRFEISDTLEATITRAVIMATE